MFHMLISPDEGLIPIDFVFLLVKSRGHKGHFCKTWFPLIFLRNIFHRAIIYNVLIAISENKNPIDFAFTRSKVKVTMLTI